MSAGNQLQGGRCMHVIRNANCVVTVLVKIEQCYGCAWIQYKVAIRGGKKNAISVGVVVRCLSACIFRFWPPILKDPRWSTLPMKCRHWAKYIGQLPPAVTRPKLYNSCLHLPNVFVPSSKSYRLPGTLHEDLYLCTFVIISRCIIRRTGNASDKSCRENQNTHFTFSNSPSPRKSCRLWDNVEKYCTAREATDGKIIWRMLLAYWIPKATNTLSVYVILISFPWQQWLRERASILRLYVQCLC
jgi:hypothetical protein